MNRHEKILVVTALLLVLAFFFVLFTNAEEAKYQPTEIQLLRLEVKQRDAQLAQKDFFIAQQNFNTAIKALTDEAAKVKTENKWPDGLVFNQEKLSFTEETPGRTQ